MTRSRGTLTGQSYTPVVLRALLLVYHGVPEAELPESHQVYARG